MDASRVSSVSTRRILANAAARSMAAALGGFALLNILGDMLRPGFDASIWWIDLRLLPNWLAGTLILTAGLCLTAMAVRMRMGIVRLYITRIVVAMLLLASIINTGSFYRLLATGAIKSAWPVPLTLITAAALGWIIWSARSGASAKTSRREIVLTVLMLGAIVLSAPLAQMFCFGKTDYRRRADVIVVFGAGVDVNGRCSDALADRVRTAVHAYRQGCADKLIFSGGPGPGATHEVEAMRELAMRFGVPREAIFLDRGGVNTDATVTNTLEMCERMGLRRILAVSHFYHLPRIKLAYNRAGRDVRTVPAKESYTLTAMPYYLAREVAAAWVYYIRPLAI